MSEALREIEIKHYNVYLYCEKCDLKMNQIFSQIRCQPGFLQFASYPKEKFLYNCKKCGFQKSTNINYPYLITREI